MADSQEVVHPKVDPNSPQLKQQPKIDGFGHLVNPAQQPAPQPAGPPQTPPPNVPETQPQQPSNPPPQQQG